MARPETDVRFGTARAGEDARPASAAALARFRRGIADTAADDELVARLQWLVRLRWIAAAGLLAATWLTSAICHAISRPLTLSVLALGLAVCNAIFWLVNRRLRTANSRAILTWSIAQGLTDLVALTLTLHYSGGAVNPFVFFYIFHTVIANILFAPPISYLHAATACVLFGAMAIVECLVPSLHVPLAGMVPAGLASSQPFVAAMLVSFCATLAITAHLTGRLAGELRRQSAERGKQERELAECTEQLAGLIHRAEMEETFGIRYENPHLRPCWEMKHCHSEICPAHRAENLRCWQVARKHCLDAQPKQNGVPGCVDCVVYKVARPDKLTEIGESFNNMMCFLERHAHDASELQKQIMHQEKMAVIGQIAAGVAHEIGNPLASISSLVQYVARKSDDPPVKENLAVVSSHIGRITRIVRDMMDFARPMDTAEELVDVNELVTQAITMAKYDKRARRVQIDVATSDGLPRTYASGDQLMQVFMNIISNAFDAMPGGGSLSIVTAEMDNEIRISFSDTGTGMTENQLTHIFEPFYTTKEVGQGTGLGLTVTDAIVRKLGGRVHVRSRRGVGSTFTICLPVRQKPEQAAGHRPQLQENKKTNTEH